MTCERITLKDGTQAIACSRTRRKAHYCACGRLATKQCDYRVTRYVSRGTAAPPLRRKGTCDRYLCDSCAVVVLPKIADGVRYTVDHCPEHARATPVAEPGQLTLF